jgi:hypothetical protein
MNAARHIDPDTLTVAPDVDALAIDLEPSDNEIETALLEAAYDELTGACPIIPARPALRVVASRAVAGYVHNCPAFFSHAERAPFTCGACGDEAVPALEGSREARWWFERRCRVCRSVMAVCSC